MEFKLILSAFSLSFITAIIALLQLIIALIYYFSKSHESTKKTVMFIASLGLLCALIISFFVNANIKSDNIKLLNKLQKLKAIENKTEVLNKDSLLDVVLTTGVPYSWRGLIFNYDGGYWPIKKSKLLVMGGDEYYDFNLELGRPYFIKRKGVQFQINVLDIMESQSQNKGGDCKIQLIEY